MCVSVSVCVIMMIVQTICFNLRYVKVVGFVLRIVSEEVYKEVIVVQCCLVVINSVVYFRIVRVRKANSGWRLHCIL